MSRYNYSSCTCGECVFLDLSDRNRYDNEKAYCSKRREYVRKSGSACSRHFEYDEARGNVSGTCYLTTIISEVLGYADNCNYLEILRDFRDTYMLENPDLVPILYEYDTIGPVLAKSIRSDKEQDEICKKLFVNYIEIIIKNIEQGNYFTAINKYIEMVKSLKEFYKEVINSYDAEKTSIDNKATGKGYLKKNNKNSKY